MGTILGDASVEEFEKYFLETLNFRIKYDDEFKLVGGEFDCINCIVFNHHSEDISNFALFRITTSDMKWLEDFCENYRGNVPSEVFSKYEDYLN